MHYQEGQDRNQVFLTSLDELLPDDSWARLVDEIVDAIPLDHFGFKNMTLKKEGNIPYHPRDLFKLLMYGYRKRIRSSLKLHEACLINIEVIWLLRGLRPSARTIINFRTNNKQAIKEARSYFLKNLKSWSRTDSESVGIQKLKSRGQFKFDFGVFATS